MFKGFHHIFGILALSVFGILPVANAISVQKQAMKYLGTTSLKKGDASLILDQSAPDPAEANNPTKKHQTNREIPNSISAARVPSSKVPRPATLQVASDLSNTSFVGLNHFEQRNAGTGVYSNTNFSVEPPDQALCVGNGFVMEAVNNAIRVRSSSGASLTDSTNLTQFFGLTPSITRSTPLVYGDFTSDPKCYYDAGTNRFFLTLLQIDLNSTTGDFGSHAKQMLAVSQTSDPTGGWYIYSFDTTNDGTNGTPTHANCPCFGDQPLIGADSTGFYITTNEFPITNPGFNGAQVYAMSKVALENGGPSPTIIQFSDLTQAEGPAYSMQPTTTPPGGAFDSANNGTEYLLSALDFDATLDNRITLWALTNTQSLDTATPALSLKKVVLTSQVYGQPPAMDQKKGSAPFDESLKGEHFNVINSNDDRMNQTVYAGGNVWGALNTVVKGPTGVTRTAVAFFIVHPSWDGDQLNGQIVKQGYVAAQNNNVAYPAIAANSSGKGIIGFTLVGPDYFPSAAYAKVDATSGPSSINVARAGVGPADGFTGEISQDPGDRGVERWGDYSAAVADDADGTIWFATEMINQTCTLEQFLADVTCGATRTILANWGTAISKVTP